LSNRDLVRRVEPVLRAPAVNSLRAQPPCEVGNCDLVGEILSAPELFIDRFAVGRAIDKILDFEIVGVAQADDAVLVKAPPSNHTPQFPAAAIAVDAEAGSASFGIERRHACCRDA
jgi:hypothetical protein